MESLPYTIPSPSRPTTTISAPSSPTRHIHSSFPHYFYSVPSSPSPDGLTAFVTHCESRLSSWATSSNSNSNSNSNSEDDDDDDEDEDFEFKLNHGFTSPQVVAPADELFRKGLLAPLEWPQLKLPPRLQQASNGKRNLGNAHGFHRRPPGSSVMWRLPRLHFKSKEVDPFAAAVARIRKEDMSWCKKRSGHRKSRWCEPVWLKPELLRRISTAGRAASKATESATVSSSKKTKRTKIIHFQNSCKTSSVTESGKNSAKKSASDGKGSDQAVAAWYKHRPQGPNLLACFGVGVRSP